MLVEFCLGAVVALVYQFLQCFKLTLRHFFYLDDKKIPQQKTTGLIDE